MTIRSNKVTLPQNLFIEDANENTKIKIKIKMKITKKNRMKWEKNSLCSIQPRFEMHIFNLCLPYKIMSTIGTKRLKIELVKLLVSFEHWWNHIFAQQCTWIQSIKLLLTSMSTCVCVCACCHLLRLHITQFSFTLYILSNTHNVRMESIFRA